MRKIIVFASPHQTNNFIIFHSIFCTFGSTGKDIKDKTSSLKLRREDDDDDEESCCPLLVEAVDEVVE